MLFGYKHDDDAARDACVVVVGVKRAVRHPGACVRTRAR